MKVKGFVSKREREKKERKKRATIGIFLTGIMLFSVLGFAFQFGIGVGGNQEQRPEQDRITYNGVEFVYNNGFWVAGGFAFRNNPNEIPDIEPEGELKDIFSYEDSPLYIYSESPEARSEISVNLGSVAERVITACPEGIDGMEDVECDEGIQTKTCSDNFIIIKEDIESRIRQEESCVFIEGQTSELSKITDEFLFKILEIK
ncbi:MAG: hypothetical protein WDZ69_01060 [Candidatus Pacearchaeota archaeon]